MLSSHLRRIQPLVARQTMAALAHAARNSNTFSTVAKKALPTKFIDTHHYFSDPSHNEFNAFLQPLGAPAYLPENYKTDVLDPLAKIGVEVEGTVHVEMTDDGVAEVKWIQSLIDEGRCDHIKAIIALCDLAAPDVEEKILELKATSPRVRGVRWILEHEGGRTPLHRHVATRPAMDYLDGDNGEALPGFERGIRVLEKHDLSFDLLCAPSQLPLAAKLFKWHSRVPVCIDHLGKPRTLLDDSINAPRKVPSSERINIWRRGMHALADIPHTYVKLSMLGYTVPGWINDKDKEEVLRDLVYETVDRFGTERCMIGLNYHLNDSMSDSDGLSASGPSPPTFLTKLSSWFESYSEDEREDLFYNTAKAFYRI